MDYTKKCKEWLDIRYSQKTVEGIYRPHQPIYGILGGYCDPGFLIRYITSYHIFSLLDRLNFNSFIDVGGSEGFTPYRVSKSFGVLVESTDLSKEACDRCEEIFNIKATPSEITKMPFKDNQFDVSLCSQTLEHVDDLAEALEELLRITKKALIITVPFEKPEQIKHNKEKKWENLHEHINHFDLESFKHYNKDYKVLKTPILSSATVSKMLSLENITNFIISGKNHDTKLEEIEKSIQDICLYFLSQDLYLVQKVENYQGIRVLILKDEDSYSESNVTNYNIQDLFSSVPYHYI